MTQRRSPSRAMNSRAVLLILLALLVVIVFARGWLAEPMRETTPKPSAASELPVAPNNGLPTITFDALPRQAQDTIHLIDQGGPFPYRQDGTIFQNRERLLPRQAAGYYREYTVVTPGASDRGARRIVAGAEGELYYTADHYASFKWVVR